MTKEIFLPLDNFPPNALPDEGSGVPAKFDLLIRSLSELDRRIPPDQLSLRDGKCAAALVVVSL